MEPNEKFAETQGKFAETQWKTAETQKYEIFPHLIKLIGVKKKLLQILSSLLICFGWKAKVFWKSLITKKLFHPKQIIGD